MNIQYILYSVVALLVAASLILSLRYGKRQRDEFDNDVAGTTVKHKMMGNPIVIALLISFAIVLAFSLLAIIY